MQSCPLIRGALVVFGWQCLAYLGGVTVASLIEYWLQVIDVRVVIAVLSGVAVALASWRGSRFSVASTALGSELLVAAVLAVSVMARKRPPPLLCDIQALDVSLVWYARMWGLSQRERHAEAS